MATISTKEILLASRLLDLAGDHFSDHGCNDMDEGLLNEAGFTDDEKRRLATEFANWDRHEPMDDLLAEFRLMQDHAWMSFLAAKLRGQVEAAEEAAKR